MSGRFIGRQIPSIFGNSPFGSDITFIMRQSHLSESACLDNRGDTCAQIPPLSDAVLEQQWQTQANGTVKFAPLAVSGNVSYAYDASKPVGQRIDPADVKIDGAPLDVD